MTVLQVHGPLGSGSAAPVAGSRSRGPGGPVPKDEVLVPGRLEALLCAAGAGFKSPPQTACKHNTRHQAPAGLVARWTPEAGAAAPRGDGWRSTHPQRRSRRRVQDAGRSDPPAAHGALERRRDRLRRPHRIPCHFLGYFQKIHSFSRSWHHRCELAPPSRPRRTEFKCGGEEGQVEGALG